MKARLFTVFIAALAVASLIAGCALTPKQVSIEVSCDDFYANPNLRNEVQVASGGTITLALCSNPTTGFQWEEKILCPLVSSILTSVDHKFIGPGEAGGVGAPGQEVWTFKAVNKGAATIILDYSQPWEGGEKEAWTYTLAVTIE